MSHSRLVLLSSIQGKPLQSCLWQYDPFYGSPCVSSIGNISDWFARCDHAAAQSRAPCDDASVLLKSVLLLTGCRRSRAAASHGQWGAATHPGARRGAPVHPQCRWAVVSSRHAWRSSLVSGGRERVVSAAPPPTHPPTVGAGRTPEHRFGALAAHPPPAHTHPPTQAVAGASASTPPLRAAHHRQRL